MTRVAAGGTVGLAIDHVVWLWHEERVFFFKYKNRILSDTCIAALVRVQRPLFRRKHGWQRADAGWNACLVLEMATLHVRAQSG